MDRRDGAGDEGSASLVAAAARLERLDSLDCAILDLLGAGSTEQEAAAALHVSLPTVRYHVGKAKAVFGALTLAQLVGDYRAAKAAAATLQDRT